MGFFLNFRTYIYIYIYIAKQTSSQFRLDFVRRSDKKKLDKNN